MEKMHKLGKIISTEHVFKIKILYRKISLNTRELESDNTSYVQNRKVLSNLLKY